MIDLSLDDFLDTASTSDVEVERERRNTADYPYQGQTYQADTVSRSRLDRAKSSALAAIQAGGGLPGDIHWTVSEHPFAWIARDNTRVPMDAETIIRLVNEIDAREGLLVVAASNLKARINGGERVLNVRDPRYWPTD